MKHIITIVLIALFAVSASAGQRSTHMPVVHYIDNHSYDAGVVNQLVSALSDQLTQNRDFSDLQGPIAITSIVSMDNVEKTSRLGNIVSESLIHEMQVRGYKVIDYKTMDEIEVGKEGDFIFSRVVEKLRSKHNVDYVLSGTCVHFREGIAINARIIDLKTHVVVSTGQIFINSHILKRLLKQDKKPMMVAPQPKNVVELSEHK